MLKIFHAPRSRSARIVWMAEEMGIPYETSIVSLREPNPEFLKANPARSVPTIIDDGVVLTELAAILQYLGERYGPTPLAPKPGAANYCDYLQFVAYGEASMAAFLNPVMATKFIGPEGAMDSYTVQAAKDMFTRRLALIDQQLARGPYMAGDEFTAADISVAYALDLGEFAELAGRYSDAVKAYRERIKARPAYQTAQAG